MWVRLVKIFYETPEEEFQFTHPCGCDTSHTLLLVTQLRFNSRTRVGATDANLLPLRSVRVSIHAPVWVRRPNESIIGFFEKFQFTHPCGCDCQPLAKQVSRKRFNSRTRVGATWIADNYRINKVVSIHAPVWVRQALNENPRPPHGFQFTHPCGCDTVQLFGKCSERVSIHAPVWVRRSGWRWRWPPQQFQFTHPCGCDRFNVLRVHIRSGFNSRTRVGATA